MSSKTLIVALAMLVSATSASLAWTHHMTRHHHGIYNYYGGAYHERGGPGPRVQAGSGMGAGAESGSR